MAPKHKHKPKSSKPKSTHSVPSTLAEAVAAGGGGGEGGGAAGAGDASLSVEMTSALSTLDPLQEKFYESLFILDHTTDSSFHPQFFCVLFKALQYTYGLPVETKCLVRKKIISDLMESAIKPYAQEQVRIKTNSLSKIKNRDKVRKLILQDTPEFYSEIQQRLELAVNANLVEKDQMADEAQCLKLLRELCENLNSDNSLFLFIGEEFTWSAPHLDRTSYAVERSRKNCLGDFILSAL